MSGTPLTRRTFCQLQQKLSEILPARPEEITPSARFDALIPPQERRHTWQQLQDAGFELPQLMLSSRVFLATALIVLAPVGLLAYLFSWTMLFSTLEVGLLARKVTRPLAIHPPSWCETVQEVVLQNTHFRQEDYKAGLWSPEDVAAKVRSIISCSVGIPLERVTQEARLQDLSI